ncbi:50S ribosomal protein L11 methyltransferase [Hoeflea poritis]|uniref:Ribosomal protein L11 methyltransferase n=1 Tax=Hoeflea poritis TaxID=2993659 RepID=A0ABT4VP27_9HYPH|nr:50S ribosomal protein L11 methyltransferase [Hoeflea poritis]MDA4846471.1 50S ribosomal protein L11 methyltransferase [Hoeflea poritis]
MKQIRLFITASQAECATALELLSERFEDAGYPIATMEVDEANDRWEASLYAPTAEQEALVRSIQDCLKPAIPDAPIETEHLPDIDWVAHALEGLQPVRAGRFLVHGSHDRDKVRPGDLCIEIDAGRAFGTGHHGTTEGCLEMIGAVARQRRFRHVLDLGTGSGVLAIGLAKLMPASILATDIDPVAIAVARQNARKNGCGSRIGWATAAGFHSGIFARHGPFDLIVANILARPLMGMAPSLSRNLAAGGQVILSGILSEQRRKVLAAYNVQGLYHRKTLWRDGWVTLHLGR